MSGRPFIGPQLPLLVEFDDVEGVAGVAVVVDLVVAVAAVAAVVAVDASAVLVAVVAASAVVADVEESLTATVAESVLVADEPVAAADMQPARARPPTTATAPEIWRALRAGCGRFLRFGVVFGVAFGVALVIIGCPFRTSSSVLVDGFIV